MKKEFKNMIIYTEKDFEKFKKKPVPMKKETIEEVVIRIEKIQREEWQGERSYSEEDLKQAFQSGFTNGFNFDIVTFEEWFEQFKNK